MGDLLQTPSRGVRRPYSSAVSTCSACGEEGPERARFCLACGVPLMPAAARRSVRKQATVLFCDLVGSTALSESLDPEALQAVLDRYFEVLTAAVRRHGGTVEKFIGDAVMAVFGLPRLHEDDALRAVRAAAEIPLAVRELDAELQRRWGVLLQVRLGVDTGEVVAGDASGGQRLAAGDAVNLAARLQVLAAPGEVVLGDATFRLVRDAVRAEPLAVDAVRGSGRTVRAHRLLALRPAGGPAGAGAAQDDSAARPAPPLAGRGEELAVLERALGEAVTDRTPRLRVVVGEAGLGKSRLIAEFLTRSAARATVLRGRCLSYGQGITYWPLREIVAEAAGWTEDDTAAQGLTRLEGLLAGQPDAAVVADRVGQLLGLTATSSSRPEAFRAVQRLLEELVRWRPLVVVVDDLHWAEPTLLDLLDHLATATAGPLLLLGGARPELLAERPGWAEADDERVVLAPLPPAEAAAVLQGRLGGQHVPAAVRETVLATAEGNPLYVEQLVGMLVDEGVLQKRDGTWVQTRAVSAGVLPASIAAVLATRLERLAPEEQREIEAGAVVGRVFWRGAVAELAREVVGPTAGEHLAGLVARQLLAPEASAFPGDDAYRFSHVLVRDAAYAAMPKAARAAAHERFAGWLEEVAGDRAEEYEEILGYHLEQAVDLRREVGLLSPGDRRLAERAGRRLAGAGRRAFQRGDLPASVGLLRRAERLLAEDDGELVDALTTLGHVLGLRGELDQAEGPLLRAIHLARRADDVRREHRARVALVDHWSFSGSERLVTAGPGVLAAALEVLQRCGDDVGVSDVWRLTGKAALDVGRAGAAQQALERALRHARRGGSRVPSEVMIYLVIALVCGPEPVGEVTDRLGRLAVESDADPSVETEVLRGRAQLAAMTGDARRARRLARRARELLVELGVDLIAASSSMVEYEIARCAGDVTAAGAALAADDDVLAGMGERSARSTILAMLAHALAAGGRLDEAERRAALAAELTQTGDLYSEVLWRTARAQVLSARGGHDEATSLAHEAVERAGASDWLLLRAHALSDLADVHERAGRPSGAADAVTAALALHVQKGDVACAARCRARLARLG